MVKELIVGEETADETTGRKTFTRQEKEYAVNNLILKQGYTAKEAADAMGCSLASIQNWKASIKKKGAAAPTEKGETSAAPARRTKKASKRAAKRTKKAVRRVTSSGRPSFAEFSQEYWDSCANEVAAGNMPPDAAFKAIPQINSALMFAYRKLCQ